MTTYTILQSHPIQYNAPLFKFLVEEGLSLRVLYLCDDQYENMRTEFQSGTRWDVELFRGYDYRFLNDFGLSSIEFLRFFGFQALREIRLHKSEYVFIHGYNYLANIVVMLYCILAKRKYIYRSESALDSKKRTFLNLIFKRLLVYPLIRNSQRVFYIGNRNLLFYRAIGVEERKLVFCPYSVDNARFEAKSDSNHNDHNSMSIRFLWVGKFIPRKRPLDVIHAFNRFVREWDGDAVLTMVGDGELLGQATTLIGEIGVGESVRLLGFTNQSALPQIYQSSDFLLITSDDEPWGLVCNEALAAGALLICSDQVGAADDLVSYGRSGFTYPSGDIIELAKKMLEAANADRASMREYSAELIKKYSYDVCASAFKSRC